MADKTFIAAATLILASTGLAIGAYLLLAPADAPTPSTAAPDLQARVGVAPAEVDSARRTDQDVDADAVDAPTPFALPNARPATARPALDRVLEARQQPAPPPTILPPPTERPALDRVLAARQNPPPPPPPREPAPPLDAEAQAAHDAHVALRTRVVADVQRELAKQSGALKDACWQPGLTGGASSANFKINASFDADGKLLARGISDDRDAGAAGVGECLRKQPLALEIPPPGQAITVDAPLRLP